MTETGRRRPQRHRTLKAGKIVLSHGTSVVDCTIRNLSPEGAAIAVDNAATCRLSSILSSAARRGTARSRGGG
jgi:hypothetical protein